MENSPLRQIHIDFHTSPEIYNTGEAFDADEFVDTLKKAHVQLVNLFAKCHHGMFYYPTKIGTMHPALKFDLLGEQIRACKKEGIRAVAYTCVGWNEDWANRHPEWQQINTDGVIGLKKPSTNEYYSWKFLCIAKKEYIELLKAELKEIYDMYKPEGFWMDIVTSNGCVCPSCTDEMRKMGLDPSKLEDIKTHDRFSEINFCKIFYEFVKELDSNLSITFNSLAYCMELEDKPNLSISEKRKYFSHIDVESLPSDIWGYTHFPIVVNYINKYNYEITMMNGKFHLAWGDFGSLRNENALEYECFRGIANGTTVCVGDQLHPVGRLEPAVYERIGRVYKSIEDKEPWLVNTKKCAEVAVYCATKVLNPTEKSNLAEEGIYRILTELQIPFDFINFDDDINRYNLVILPDWVQLPIRVAEKINKYTANGKKMLVTNMSGLNEDGKEFIIDSIRADYIGESQFDTRYIRLKNTEFNSVPQMDHVLYMKGQSICAKDDSKILATIVNPYFNRTAEHFCSHRQTPPLVDSSNEPAIVEGNNGIYISSPLFTDYAYHGYKVYKDIVAECINKLVTRPLIKSQLTSMSELTVRQNNDGIIIHTLNYCIQHKCKKLDTIEDKLELHNRRFGVRTDYQPSAVMIVPEKTALDFTYSDGYTNFTMPVLSGHNMIFIAR